MLWGFMRLFGPKCTKQSKCIGSSCSSGAACGQNRPAALSDVTLRRMSPDRTADSLAAVAAIGALGRTRRLLKSSSTPSERHAHAVLGACTRAVVEFDRVYDAVGNRQEHLTD